jgi:uncharacterized protein (TIGR01370 family)
VKQLCLVCLGWLLAGWVSAAPAVAFFYGAQPPWDALQAFDVVVVDPDHVPNPAAPALAHTRLAAYVAVGEVQPSRAYAARIPSAWLRGENSAWGSRLIDQATPEWPRFFVQRVIAPLWAAGYRSFFLDTLDSYHLYAKTPQERARQEAGLVALVTQLKQQYPQAELIFNRGFEILEQTHQYVSFVAAESLYQGYDASRNSYRSVPAADREWLLTQFKRVHDDYQIPVIAIDYVPARDRELARTTARQIEAQGFIPWVATPDLASVGIGLVEVMPRRVLVVHSPLANEYQLRETAAVRYATMPLNYLGYAVDYVDLRHLPPTVSPDRYAGVVLWLEARGTGTERKNLGTWLAQRLEENMPLAVMDDIAPLLEAPLAGKVGITAPPGTESLAPITVTEQADMLGFERKPRPQAAEFTATRLTQGRPLLTLSQGKSQQVAAAIMPWGGFVMQPYGLVNLPTTGESRWVIDPFAFFREALRLPAMPVPDTTTESGRRLLLVHMDGDGFVNRSELPGTPFAGEVVRDRVVRKYPLPMTISVIEAEVSPQGLYPQYAQQLEAVARDIFRAPNVEIASHSYTHPFNWSKVAAPDETGDYHLKVPGYTFDLQREIEGSVRYIESRLAPAGKKVTLFLWTGNCVPGRDALEWTQRLGIMNMNGGDTIATRSNPSLTAVEGLGMERNGLFQVFAPNQNENVYTNNWTGPFYGFERVIETYELTESPRRLKPIDIYFHTYLTTRQAGMRSLDKIFAYALAQETTPVFASEYARKVADFSRVAVARTATSWRIRGAENVRTLRAPAALGAPDVDTSQAVAGFNIHGGATYIHLAGASADLAFAPRTATSVRLVSANARVDAFAHTPTGYRWTLAGHVPIRFTLANAARCSVRVAGREVSPTRDANGDFHYQLNTHAASPLEAICRD